MNNKNFIITHSKEISERLSTLGFQELPSNTVDIYIFINSEELKFANDIDMSKIKFSNKLFY